jgi:serine/threonine-protein kinase
VCYQSYSYGTWVPKESEIEIRISKGPEFSYRCNIDVQAPTQAEAPGYVTGTPVAIKLLADDGKILVDATVTSFPYTINAYGLNTAGGTLTLVYTVTKEPTSTTGPDGQIVTVPGKQEERFFSRRVEFSAE